MDDRLAAIDLALKENDVRKAEVLIAKALRDERLSGDVRAEIRIRRAQARLVAGRPDDALEEANEVLALRPDFETHPDVQVMLGDIYFARFVLAEFGFADRANTEKSLSYYDNVINNHPEYDGFGWVYYQRGCVYLSENHIEDAVINLKAALRYPATPNYLHAYCYERLGFIALFEQRDTTQAVEYLEQAIELYPKAAGTTWLTQVHILRSRALREQKNYTAALKAASMALDTLDPNAQDYRRAFPETHLAIGEVMADIPGRESDAINHLLQYLQNSKRPPGVDVTWSRVYETMGELSFKLKRYEQAIEAFQASLQFNPYHPWEVNIYYQIARSYYRMRAYERVIESFQHMQTAASRENQPITDYRVYYVLANAYFALEHYGDAASAYQTALELAPPGADNRDKIQKYLNYSQELAPG